MNSIYYLIWGTLLVGITTAGLAGFCLISGNYLLAIANVTLSAINFVTLSVALSIRDRRE